MNKKLMSGMGALLLSATMFAGTPEKFVVKGQLANIGDTLIALRSAEKIPASGVEAKDFTLKDLDGKPFTLSSLRGKYVVIDFWGSWCYWCIKGMPEMKKYYDKYKGKFEIVGVDCQDTPEKWRAAVKKNQMTWKQVYCDSDSHLLEDYAISGFPTKILVDPQGKIVKTVVGEDPAFYELLDEKLK